ncbi:MULTISPECIES: hypothetical protein [unclassified Nostoc]|uniref:hypothetical protein n=1 Tax=unclassified Nostoc TaxID=2593658 RepID=UPI002609D70F|nr:hypothetical protein [Nostoc sp. S13]MDF5735072.1 hypothetical protein [Nostoc sp. S13]
MGVDINSVYYLVDFAVVFELGLAQLIPFWILDFPAKRYANGVTLRLLYETLRLLPRRGTLSAKTLSRTLLNLGLGIVQVL